MLKKKISKEFDLKDFNAKAEVTAFIHKISYREVQEKKKKTLAFLKSIPKCDREKLFDAITSGNIGKVLSLMDDFEMISKFLNNVHENVRLCIRDTLEIKIIDESGEGEVFKDAWDNKDCPITKEINDWIDEQCIALNPELFNAQILEKKN